MRCPHCGNSVDEKPLDEPFLAQFADDPTPPPIQNYRRPGKLIAPPRIAPAARTILLPKNWWMWALAALPVVYVLIKGLESIYWWHRYDLLPPWLWGG